MVLRITIFFHEKGLFNPYQAGFQKGKSTMHQLIRLAEHVMRWFNKKHAGRTITIFIAAELSAISPRNRRPQENQSSKRGVIFGAELRIEIALESHISTIRADNRFEARGDRQ
mgnify:CR=1 FL=1